MSVILDKVQERFNEALKETAHDILQALLVLAVSKMHKAGGVPVQSQLTIRSGNLARAVQVGDISRFGTDNQVGAEKIIRNRYAALHERGGTVVQSIRQRRAMFKRLRELGWYVKGRRGAITGSAVYPPRPFIDLAIKKVDSQSILKRKLKQMFPDKKERTTIGG